jgi:hypothetical protein
VVTSLELLKKDSHHFPVSRLGLHAYDDDDDNMVRYDFEHFSVVLRKADL